MRIAKEGEILNKWFANRMKQNKNVIMVVTGSTGSGKSYTCLRMGELWYSHFFKEKFPIRHICFSILEVMELLNSGKTREGEMVILEEAGINLNNLEFQNRLSKMFTFILQSFRSLNIILIMNLPVFSLLNKTARLLTHSHFITLGINYQTKECKLKGFFHQINQQTGKIYPKYMRLITREGQVAIKRYNFHLPSEYLISDYEKKKDLFVKELSKVGYERAQGDKKELTDAQIDYVNLYKKFNENANKVAEYLGTSVRNVHKHIRKARIRQLELTEPKPAPILT